MKEFDKNFKLTCIDFILSNTDTSDWGPFVKEASRYSFLKNDKIFLNALEKNYDKNKFLTSLIYNTIKTNSETWKKKLLISFGRHVNSNYPKLELLNPIGNWKTANKPIYFWFTKLIADFEALECEGCSSILVPTFIRSSRFCCTEENCDFYLIPVYDNHCHSCLEDVSSKYHYECDTCEWIICGNCNSCADPRYQTCNATIPKETSISLKSIVDEDFDNVKAFKSTLISNIYNESIKSPIKYIHSPNVNKNNCDRGKEIIKDRNSLDNYIRLYFIMHVSKLFQTFSNTNFSSFDKKETTIIDWGCGQGVGTLSLLEYLQYSNNDNISIGKIILIEPSVAATGRAKEFIELSNISKSNNIKVEIINNEIDNIDTSQIGKNIDNCIHIFSNILDLETINISNLSENFLTIAGSNNLSVCISPKYSNAIKNIDSFCGYLKEKDFEETYFTDSSFKISSYDVFLKKERRMIRTQYSKILYYS